MKGLCIMRKKLNSLHFKMLGGILLPSLIVFVLTGMFITNSVGKSTHQQMPLLFPMKQMSFLQNILQK